MTFPLMRRSGAANNARTVTGRPGLLLLLTFATLAGTFGCLHDDGGVDRDAYVERNQDVFEALPRFPQSRVTGETSTAYRESESGPVIGYTTRYDVSLPSEADPGRVADFYRAALRPDWRLIEELAGPVLNFRRSRAFVSINVENWRINRLEVAVDHAWSSARAGRSAAGGQLLFDETRGRFRGVPIGASLRDVRAVVGAGVPGQFIGPLGMNTIQDLAGPTFIPSPAGSKGPWVAWRYESFSVLARGGRVYAIVVTDRRAKTSRAVAIGEELAAAKQAYDLECREANEGTEYGTFPACTGSVAPRRWIWIGGDPIKSITVASVPLGRGP
jgi:hypothetical protein